MKALSPKTIFIFSSRTYFCNSEISQKTLGQFSQFSTSTNQFHSSYPSRRHEEESRNVRVSVWWDFENCSLPTGANVFTVAQSITAAIRANGIKGPIQISAFGDVLQLSRTNQEALSSTGITLTHIPQGGKNSADRSLLVDLMYWVSQNPPPAHLFLISGDRDFSSILHRLRMNNYNILLSSPDSAPGVLCSAASIMWQWNALVRGENLSGKHFNQPPDGPYGSWYGHYRLPLEDPFAITEQTVSSRVEESSESGSDPKTRPVPKAVVKQIRHILNLYPKGISVAELRSELGKTNVNLDKDFYGYKKFTRFLLSMPHILKFKPWGDGQLSIYSAAPKVPEHMEDAPGITRAPVTNDEDLNQDISAKRNGKDNPCTGLDGKVSLPLSPTTHGDLNQEIVAKRIGKEIPFTGMEEKVLLPSSPKGNVREPLIKSQNSPKEVEELLKKEPEPSSVVEKANNVKVTEGHLPPIEEKDPTSEVGLFKSLWRKWFGDKVSGYENCCRKPDKHDTSSCTTQNIKGTEEKSMDLTSQYVDPVGLPSNSSSTNEAIIEENIARNSETKNDASGTGPGFLNQIIKWCKFWSVHKDDSEEHNLFSKESFWNDMMVFLDTSKGFEVVTRSKTREEMAQHLQKQGPSILRSLCESESFHLVDLLISDKKWVEECPSQNFPFKLIRPAGKSSLFSSPTKSNGLRSIFLDAQSPFDSQRVPEFEEKRHQNLPHTGFSPSTAHKKPSKSRSEILADCQMLVNYIVKENPEGFNMGCFRKLFIDTYGYSLDLQKLGYPKLVSLLQDMPGVKVECNYIYSSGKALKNFGQEVVDRSDSQNNLDGKTPNSDRDSSGVSRRDDDSDSQWEELGPIANTSPKSNVMESSRRKVKEETAGQVKYGYEPLSEDDLSDSDEEPLSTTESQGQEKPRPKEEDSSLLQILDSWHRTKEDNNKTVASENVNGTVDTSREAPIRIYGRKQRPYKSYSFVSDQAGDGKDKLIDGILGSLKTSGERSADRRIQG